MHGIKSSMEMEGSIKKSQQILSVATGHMYYTEGAWRGYGHWMDQHPSGIDDVICFILHCACILGIEKYDITIDILSFGRD